MSTTVHPHKRKDVQTVIVHVVKLSVREGSIKVMAKSSTMLAPIARVDSRMYQLASPLAMLIASVSRHVLK